MADSQKPRKRIKDHDPEATARAGIPSEGAGADVGETTAARGDAEKSPERFEAAGGRPGWRTAGGLEGENPAWLEADDDDRGEDER